MDILRVFPVEFAPPKADSPILIWHPRQAF